MFDRPHRELISDNIPSNLMLAKCNRHLTRVTWHYDCMCPVADVLAPSQSRTLSQSGVVSKEPRTYVHGLCMNWTMNAKSLRTISDEKYVLGCKLVG